MKKIILIGLLIIAVFYIVKQKVYKPYMWQKATNTNEHRLQLGSFIFSKQSGSNGSQSNEDKFLVFKVIEIKGDFVRLSVVRQLSKKNTILESDFSTTSNKYEELKQNINRFVITGIQSNDLYEGDGTSFTLNDYLLRRYPNLMKSRYYYEDISEKEKNKPLPTNAGDLESFFSLVYSKEQIITNGKLILWVINNNLNNTPELFYRLSEDIELIVN